MVIDPRYTCLMTAYQHNEDVLYSLKGILRMQNSEEIKRQIIGVLVRDGVKTFYLNVASLSAIDSAGLGLLVGLHMTARKLKKDFQILSPTAYQMRLLEGTRLTSILTIISGVEAESIRCRLEKIDYEIPIEGPTD